ncbi:orotate phosphoribosyltransferase [Oceanobacillus luteolus]|nr:orotate phosphoribosyltransferase [Oceanobacillus luteolus]
MEKELVHDLLEIQAVQINADNYFTWTSGVKSPIYCDNRLIMSYPQIRKKIINGFIEIINEKKWQPEVIAGCATAGIPHAAWLSGALDLPMVYVRSKPKGHGKGNQIEGKVLPGQRVLVIEDLISTGGSSIEAAKALSAEGAEVISIMAIFSYGLPKAKKNFELAGYIYDTITNFDRLLDALVETSQLTIDEKNGMIEWRNTL